MARIVKLRLGRAGIGGIMRTIENMTRLESNQEKQRSIRDIKKDTCHTGTAIREQASFMIHHNSANTTAINRAIISLKL
jgi:hypothetical protein